MSWSSFKLRSIPLTTEHWTSDYIPISYARINRASSRTFYLADTTGAYPKLYFLTRVYVLSNRIELGDVCLDEGLRGKRDPGSGEKISHILLRRVIRQIWKFYPTQTQIWLRVHESNLPAISLYTALGFRVARANLRSGFFTASAPGLLMVREKARVLNQPEESEIEIGVILLVILPVKSIRISERRIFALRMVERIRL